jgi:hypothetical protein
MKYNVGDKVVCIKEETGRTSLPLVKLYKTYTVRVDFGEEDNPNVTFNMLENIIMLEETLEFHSKKYFIPISEFRKQKILNIFEDL